MVSKYKKHIFNVSFRWSDIALPLLLILLGSIVFYVQQIALSSDMTHYLNLGLNLLHGKGYVDEKWAPAVNKGPLFPLLICLSYKVFGISPDSGFVIVRLFAILNPVIIFYLASLLFNRKIGLAAALLALTSYSISYLSYRHIDAIWPAFAMLFIMTSYLAIKNISHVLFILSGIILACAYLTKSIAICLLPLPFIIFVIKKEYHSKNRVIGLIAFLVIFSAIVAPWCVYLWEHTQRLDTAIFGKPLFRLISYYNNANQTIHKAITFPGIASFSVFNLGKSFYYGVRDYYAAGTVSLYNNFIFAPFFALSWLYVAIKCITKDKACQIICIAFVLLSPCIARAGMMGLRPGQLIIVYFLSYLALAIFVFDISSLLVRLKVRVFDIQLPFLHFGVFFLVIIALIIIQTFHKKHNDRGFIQFAIQSSVVQSLYTPSTNNLFNLPIRLDIPLKFRYLYGHRDFMMFTEQISKVLSNKEPLLVTDRIISRAAYFYLKGRHRVIEAPFKRCQKSVSTARTHSKYIKTTFNCKPSQKEAIYIRAHLNWKRAKYHLSILEENALFCDLNTHKIRYILVSSLNPGLIGYFNESEMFDKISIDKNINNYKLYRFSPLNRAKYRKGRSNPYISSYFRKSMRLLYENDRATFYNLTRRCLCDIAGLGTGQILMMIFGDYDKIVKKRCSYNNLVMKPSISETRGDQ